METLLSSSGLFHGYLVVGDTHIALAEVRRILSERHFFPDDEVTIQTMMFDAMGIPEARLLRNELERKATRPHRIVLVTAETVTREAQQSLLKALEEPAIGTHVFLFVPRGVSVLNTLQSRLLYVESSTSEDMVTAKKFLASTIGERSKLLAPFLKEKQRKDPASFLHALEILVGRSFEQAPSSIALKESLRVISMIRGYITDRGSSRKLLLEYLAVALPKHK